MTTQQIEQAVNHPMHYNRGSIEVWDFIADWRLDYLRGNAVKYIARAGFKDDREQDLRKALAYIVKAQENTTYSRSMDGLEVRYSPIEFAQDQKLSPVLAAAVEMICEWKLDGAEYFVRQALRELAQPEEKHPPVVYGTDEERLSDNRNDPRIVEFGKRMGENR